MSRSGYSDDFDGGDWAMICYRGAVASAMRGRRGQAFLRDLLAALDALPQPRLIADELQQDGEVCAIGAVGRMRGVDMTGMEAENIERVASVFGIADAMAREIVYANDRECAYWIDETPEERFKRMRDWVVRQIT